MAGALSIMMSHGPSYVITIDGGCTLTNGNLKGSTEKFVLTVKSTIPPSAFKWSTTVGALDTTSNQETVLLLTTPQDETTIAVVTCEATIGSSKVKAETKCILTNTHSTAPGTKTTKT